MENERYLISKAPNPKDLTLTPKGKHMFTVIWLHGLGDSAYGWLPYFQNAETNPFPASAKIVLPTAPMIKITLNQGFPMNAWADIKKMVTSAVDDSNADEFFNID